MASEGAALELHSPQICWSIRHKRNYASQELPAFGLVCRLLSHCPLTFLIRYSWYMMRSLRAVLVVSRGWAPVLDAKQELPCLWN